MLVGHVDELAHRNAREALLVEELLFGMVEELFRVRVVKATSLHAHGLCQLVILADADPFCFQLSRIRGCGRFLGVVFLYGQPLACSVFYRTFPAQRLFDPRMVVPVDVFAGEVDDLLARAFLPMLGIHGLDLHTAEEPLGRGVVGAAPLRAHGPDQAVPAHPFQPSRPPVMTTAVTVDHGTLAGPQRGGGPIRHRVFRQVRACRSGW